MVRFIFDVSAGFYATLVSNLDVNSCSFSQHILDQDVVGDKRTEKSLHKLLGPCLSQVSHFGFYPADTKIPLSRHHDRLCCVATLPADLPEPPLDTLPARGAIEAKPTNKDAFEVAKSEQVAKYLKRYRQVLVTNFRDFVLVGLDGDGKRRILESYRLAKDEESFWNAAAHPRAIADREGERFADFLRRVILHAADLAQPKDVAAFLASYAREARWRVERHDLAALAALREALEQALGLKFEGSEGEHFFRSTLVQTLFYGAFAAWVLWSKEHSPSDRKAQFDWRLAGYHLHVPIVGVLFHQLIEPTQLKTLGR